METEVRFLPPTLMNRIEHLRKLVEFGSVCAEIGVYKGDFAAQIIDVIQPAEIHLIDPWRHEPTYGSDCWYGSLSSQEEMDSIYQGVLKRFPTAAIHRLRSEEAAGLFSDRYFDWVYIDGNHLYEFVKKDLELYSWKVKKMIIGDDYTLAGWWVDGVKKAVDDFVAESGWSLIETSPNFCLMRPRKTFV